MTGFQLTPAAKSDLDAIWDYTAERWDVDQAESYVREIRDACVRLVDGLSRGTPIDEIRPGYLKLAVGSHFLFYRKAVGGGLDIIRILHQRMDIPGRLGEGPEVSRG